MEYSYKLLLIWFPSLLLCFSDIFCKKYLKTQYAPDSIVLRTFKSPNGPLLMALGNLRSKSTFPCAQQLRKCLTVFM